MQTAKLKLPVKQFHQLYDLLGDVLDHYGHENLDFNMDNSDIEFIEDIRHELFNQIPDEEPIETTYAFTSVANLNSITPIKLYKISRVEKGGFLMHNDHDSQIFCLDKGCNHLSSDKSKDWNFVTIPNN
jgi:hypothetical protein